MTKKTYKWEALSGSMTVVAMVCVMTVSNRYSGLWWIAFAILLVALGAINASYLRLHREAAEARGEPGRPGRAG